MNSATMLPHYSICPVLAVTNMPRALAYYRDTLAMTEQFLWEEDGQVTYAILHFGDEAKTIHLTLHKEARPALVYIFWEGIDAQYEKFQNAGATITQKLEQFPWGMREFEITDPDDNRLIFGEGIEEEASVES